MQLVATVLAALSSFCLLANAIPIDNGVKGYPHVTCGPHSVTVDVDTERPLNGRIYVKGEVHRQECVRTFTGRPEPWAVENSGGYGQPAPPQEWGGEKVGIELKFGDCNMRRQRTLHPRGVEYTFTMVVSFHPLFLTKVDRAYRVRCFYMEAVKTVNAAIDVSMLTTHQLNEQFPMPTCTYHLRRGLDGPPIRFAKVGDKVTHVWQCDKVAGWVFGMLVHSCFVDDGAGNKVQLIDNKGCGVDRHLVPQVNYDNLLITAHAETHVFKYADKQHLFFSCTV
uniref:ZP domain-containing protein n=1 Tax=Plectus sambesii TaxID=2011161 RepID=A0A914UPM2_9BILA